MRWIDATDLKNWAPRRDCQEHLPLVMRKLIRATSQEISQIQFSAGDSVIYPGWDGILEAALGTEYIPEGTSRWEISSRQDIKDKAEEDYQKRKEDPLGVTPSETTFIFVTPLIWSTKDNWCMDKKKEGFWKDVRAYDATILEEWLEQAPAVGAWLARHLRIYPKGVQALEDFWTEWSSLTSPNLTPELALAGRNQQADDVRNWLRAKPGTLTVRATTRKEIIAFLASVIYTLPESEKDFWLSRSIVVEDMDSFRQLMVTNKSDLLLIAGFEEVEGTAIASQRGHHVYVPIEPVNTITQEKVELPRLGREEFVSALKQMGLSEDDAKKYSMETGRNLTVLRRRLTDIRDQPEWAKPDVARDLIPVLLAQQWSEKREADKEIISKLAGKSYDQYSLSLNSWLHRPDSPILKIGDLWRLASPMDAWFALATYVTKADIQLLDAVVKEVLGSIDPAFDMEPEQRWYAPIHDKVPTYSNVLRKGISQTLVLIAVFGEETKMSAVKDSQTWVDRIIYKLLHNADWKFWCSLSDVLPIISEASPDSVLEVLESALLQDQPPVMDMFSETGDPLTSSSYYSWLLWALEGLAWDPKLLGRVALILGKLARLDPGGTMSNRPSVSLRNIFILWRPQTYTSLEQRFEIIDALVKSEPEVGWELLINLVPSSREFLMPNHKTRWRKFSEKPEEQVTIPVLIQSIGYISERLLNYVGVKGSKWSKIIEKFNNFPPPERHKFIERLSSCASEIDNDHEKLRKSLRDLLSHHRSYPGEDWALPTQELKELEKIYEELEPLDAVERVSWLFNDGWPNLPEGKQGVDYEQLGKIVAQRRIEAVKEINCEQGFDGLKRLANQTEYSWIVGVAVSDAGLSEAEEQELISLLESSERKIVEFVQSYIRSLAIKKTDLGMNNLIQEARSKKWQHEKIVNLFIALPENREVWSMLESFDEKIQHKYWEKCSARLFDLQTDDIIYAINKLLEAKRHNSVIDTAYFSRTEIPTRLIINILKRTAVETGIENFQQVNFHHVIELFKALDNDKDVQEEDMLQLEWLYVRFLSSIGSDRPPKTLHKKLSTIPEFFAEMISYRYKPESNKQKEKQETLSKEEMEYRAYSVIELLDCWKTVPGSDQRGQINFNDLLTWVNKSRFLCKKLDIMTGCDIHIGMVLAHAIMEEESVWPPEPVCKLIDEVKIDMIDRHFIVQIENNRGIVSRTLDEGGRQERVLTEQFQQFAEKWENRYPRTAKLLTKVAKYYAIDAKQEDNEAESRDLEY